MVAWSMTLRDPFWQGRYLRKGGRGATASAPIKVQAKNNMKCKTTHTCRHIVARRLPCHCDVQTVCLHKYATTWPPIVPQFDVSFAPEYCCYQGEIFSLKFTKYRLAAGFRPDPLGEPKRSPDPLPATIRGLLLRGGKGRGEEGEERLLHTCKTSSMPL